LIDLYKRCAFTVFPSVMEGFGLPILESLWFGKPCICANFGAMAEVARGGGCLVIDAANIDELQDAITSLISSPEKISQLSDQARSRHIDSWHDYASSLLHQFTDLENPIGKLGHIYYWIDHTVTYDGNSGIQRVTRGLARALLELGLKVIPVKWSEQEKILIPAEDSDLTHFARWNGPNPSLWSQWIPVSNTSPNDWLLIPELTHYLSRTGPRDIHAFCKKVGIRCSWIFHDAIPWKMTDIYPPEATKAHSDYMIALNGADKVLANSAFSRGDLLSFLGSTQERAGAIEKRVSACVLPGEFLEVERVVAPKSRRGVHAIRILSVGTVEPRKNHLNLLRAVKLAREKSSTPIELTIAGGDSFPDLTRQVQQLVDSIPGTTWVRRVDDAGLQALYQDCDFTVYPSIAEGFGLPILESLWNARPCICANFGAMEEVAVGGGCLTVDMTSVTEITRGILELVNDSARRDRLGQEASTREFKTWKDYGLEVAAELAGERPLLFDTTAETTFESPQQLYSEMSNLEKRPLLSICISTYNRARWLSQSLRNINRLIPNAIEGVEILVCDNTSTDLTPDIVKPYLSRPDFRYVRNPENVGMLGNLRVTANQARGKYVWILGDDDLLKPGSIQRVIDAIDKNPDIALLYLNYSYTREDNADLIQDLDKFLHDSTPIVESSPDMAGTVRDICAQSENFFTAIYCLVFRRDHAIRAYSQNTSGRPFSTLLTCIPTTYHVLHHMMDERAYWIGTPQLVVNMNVSWMRYAPLWILERIPEVFNLAEKNGADPKLIDRWRVHNIPGILHFYQQIFIDDPEGNASFVSIPRLVNSFKHLQEFRAIADSLKEIYKNAHDKKHPLATDSPDLVFSAFN
jgi:glycosyltransferase involved in cell wall biosynthesis